MYSVRKDASFENMANKILQSHFNRRYINCLGSGHNLRTLSVALDSKFPIVFDDEATNDSFVIDIYALSFDFKLDILPKNAYWYSHRWIVDKYVNGVRIPGSDNVIQTDRQTFAIPFGSFVKLFWKKVHALKEPPQLSADKKENDKLYTVIKKLIMVDTNKENFTDIIGRYIPGCNTIHLWNEVKINNFNCEFGSHVSLEHIAQKMILLSETTMNYFIKAEKYIPPKIKAKRNTVDADSINKFSEELLKQQTLKSTAETNLNTVIKDNYIYQPEPNNIKATLEDLGNINFITRMLNFYLYNKDPTPTNEIELFDPPKSVPDILMYMYDKTGDNTYKTNYNEIMKKVNQREQKALDEKYPEQVFSDIQTVPDIYPPYALRKVFLCQWSDNDTRHLDDHQRDYMLRVKSRRSKHLINTTGKELTDKEVCRRLPHRKERRHNGFCSCSQCKGKSWRKLKANTNTLKDIIKDAS
jgi:hypothetical protein